MKRAVTAALVFALALAAARPASADAVYFVKEGDTLYGIARAFGTSVDGLKGANGLAANLLHPGDRLSIPEGNLSSLASGTGKTPAAGTKTAVPAPAGPAEAASWPAAAPDPAAPGGGEGRCKPAMLSHTVRRGENPWSISRKYDIRLEDLLRQNGLDRSSILSIGQRLTIKSAPRVYEVEAGDNLWGVAARFGVPAGNLRKLNALEGDTLVAGQAIYLDACREDPPEASAAYGPFPLESEVRASLGVTPPEQVPGLAQRLVAFAETMLNVPYRFGGSTLKGIDCSAFTQRAFSFLDIVLPRTTYEQFRLGEAVARDQLAAGDLVFFQTWARGASHVGIYLGGDKFIHASSGGRRAVTYSTITDPYYAKRYMGARRLLFEENATAKAPPAPKL